MDANATGSTGAPESNSQQLESDTIDTDAVPSPSPAKLFKANAETFQKAIGDVFTHLMEEETFNFISNCGRQLRFGDMEALGVLEERSNDKIIDTPGYDIFGNPLAKKTNFECPCTNCGRTIAASRYAPHLEKCMGMGRNSSRIANLKNRRLAASSNSTTVTASSINRDVNVFNQNTNSNSSDGSNDSSPLKNCEEVISEEEHYEEDEDDEEWTIEKKKKSKKPGDKVSPKKKGPVGRLKLAEIRRLKRGESPTVANSPISTTSSTMDVGNYDELTNDSFPN